MYFEALPTRCGPLPPTLPPSREMDGSGETRGEKPHPHPAATEAGRQRPRAEQPVSHFEGSEDVNRAELPLQFKIPRESSSDAAFPRDSAVLVRLGPGGTAS